MGNSIYELMGDALHDHLSFGYVQGCPACEQYDRDMAAVGLPPGPYVRIQVGSPS